MRRILLDPTVRRDNNLSSMPVDDEDLPYDSSIRI
jgi:hypothetical protein